jgi:hypothetical protein
MERAPVLAPELDGARAVGGIVAGCLQTAHARLVRLELGLRLAERDAGRLHVDERKARITNRFLDDGREPGQIGRGSLRDEARVSP